MALSIQTNVNSLIAQENLRVNSDFQGRTIQRLTSGYRINAAGDDAAGLAVANKFRSDVAELTQGVRNANDGVSQLQIIDGGLNNVSKILDRLKTLATQSASDTFTGNRATLNNEYQALLKEIDRQASNVGLVNNGSFNANISVYLGGGSTQANAQVSVDLSGSGNVVDAAGLGVSATSVAAGGTTLSGNAINTLNNASQVFLSGGANRTNTFTFNIIDSAGAQQAVTATVSSNASTTGISASTAISQLNTQLSSYGITAAVNSSGSLVFGGTRAYSITNVALGGGAVAGTGVATAGSTGVNIADSNATSAAFAAITGSEVFSVSNGSVTKFITLDNTVAAATNAIDTINAQTASLGIYAVQGTGANTVTMMSNGAFTMNKVTDATAGGLFTGTTAGNAIAVTAPNTTATATGNALGALTSIVSAVSKLGTVQGRVGTAQNQLQYAINLAQSQVSNFSAADSRIRDTDVAAEAANLTKATVLQQASLAAMAQANSAPQAVLALLRG